MRLSIMEYNRMLWQGLTKRVTLPAVEGQMCVLDFHQPFLVKLKKGYIESDENNTLINEGVAFMHNNELTLLVKTR